MTLDVTPLSTCSMSSSIGTSFLSAFQASISILLTISYGVIAARLNLLSETSGRAVSKTCIRMFLPALLIANVGSQLHLDTFHRYIPILLWSIGYNLLSLLLGEILTKLFHLPTWVTPAIAFNNTTSLPLLLIQSLEVTGVLKSLDTSSDLIDRIKSYFLVNAMIGNSLTFALGPKLLNPHEEDAPTPPNERNDDDDDITEETPLLPSRLVRAEHHEAQRIHRISCHITKLPHWLQQPLIFIAQFNNPPVIGALIGAFIGLIPALHRLFFNPTNNGGYLKAWLTTSIQNIGDLFPSLQIIVVGVKLSQSMIKMKSGESSGVVPWTTFVLVSFIRYILWPLISIPVIWALATRTRVLGSDPVLWFALMLMPAGPPALKLMALTDVEAEDEEEKMAVAKFLTLSYAISPLICLAVVGSLKASEAALGST